MGLGIAILGAMAAISAPAPAHCPAGIPVQPITVINQAHASPLALGRVERAVTDQSIQLRAAWGTPCVEFSRNGWPVYLRIGGTERGVHWANPTRAEIYTDGLPYLGWSQVFSHEIVETLVDPTTTNTYTTGDQNGSTVEVADPVDERAYKLDGVWVSDFVLPAYFAGARYGMCSSVVANGQLQNICNGPLVAADDALGPYDQMGILTGPWQTQWERANPS